MNLVAVVMVVVLGLWSTTRVGADPQVPCYFIFGDSLVDNGNNNQLNSLAKANYLPYGIDFGGGPTGRFSNGKTTVDVVGKFFSQFSFKIYFQGYISKYVVKILLNYTLFI